MWIGGWGGSRCQVLRERAGHEGFQANAGLAAAIAVFCSVLNEKQRRLFAGLASLLCGRGGDRRAAALLGLHRKTVAKGRRQLTTGDVEADRVRKRDGGRKPLQENTLG